MYAIVDIETTGGVSGRNRIIEIAIYLSDGDKITDSYETLVNPDIQLPNYITSLTGITNEMLLVAPPFTEIADKVYNMLHGKVFVAHNVQFDYSFLKQEFQYFGIDYNPKKLCTVRLSRNILPGFKSYGLGSLARRLNIAISERHRAAGDAKATAEVLHFLIKKDHNNYIEYSLNRNSKEATLPPNISVDTVNQLPEKPGVYYFLNQKGRVIYIGKAKNIKKRVTSHFTGNSDLKKHRKFLDLVEDIDYQLCGNELMALLYECIEIKRLYPEFNRALKLSRLNYGIYTYEDRNGYTRLAIAKTGKFIGAPIITFRNLSEARNFLQSKIKAFQLCAKLCGLQKSLKQCYDFSTGICKGACVLKETSAAYNSRLDAMIQSFDKNYQSYMILGKGRRYDENSIVLVQNGSFKGLGFIDTQECIEDVEMLKHHIQSYADDQDIQRILEMHLRQNTTDRIVPLSNDHAQAIKM